MKKILIVSILVISILTIDRIDYSTLENSHIKTINGEQVQGLVINKRYNEYTNSIDVYINEDSGIVIYYNNNPSDIKLVNNL